MSTISASVASQTSNFFMLPEELRNQIYGDVVENNDTVSLRGDRLLYTPALSLVCHQIRNEYEEIYVDEAIESAGSFHIHSNNFVCKGPAIKQYRYDMRQLIEGKVLEPDRTGRSTRVCKVIVRWDPISFDVEYLKQTVRKLNWYYAPTYAFTKSVWPIFGQAIEEATQRYETDRLEKVK
ncbi:hypothetical protein LTR09_000081 [Extremus antarcticus]|uniref:Uncharacterized protein n=1 Tax=Extremus antarcticus TaxID=702011 RepID=A0AAJ0GIZ8_9PEZI|nr:hypothetical protein LTR09_000081 [Extremus antarcticus]